MWSATYYTAVHAIKHRDHMYSSDRNEAMDLEAVAV